MSYITELFGRDEDGGKTRLKIGATGRVPDISFAHQEVHADGILIATMHDTDVDIITPISILIEAEEGYEVHSDFTVIPTSPVRMQLSEIASTDVTSQGTALTCMRLNRGSTIGDTERVFTYHTPTLASTGTLLLDIHSGGSTSATPNAPAIGSPAHPGAEIKMYPGKAYLWNITPDQDNTQITVKHEYYEVKL